MSESARRELPVVRKGQGTVKLTRELFERQLRERFGWPGVNFWANSMRIYPDMCA